MSLNSILLYFKMKYFVILLGVLAFYTSFSQTNWRDTLTSLNRQQIDTCEKIKQISLSNLVVDRRHSIALYLANDDIIISGNVLDSNTNLIKDVQVLRCPEAFIKYGYIGYNGAIIIKTKQQFETITPYEIGFIKFGKSKEGIHYALNGDLLSDIRIKISKASIKEIEILKPGKRKGINKSLTKFACINIWTLDEKDRAPIPGQCRGLRISSEKKD